MSMQHLLMVGAHQRSTPIAIRERIAIGPDALAATHAALAAHASELFILSTCNRTEIYAVSDDPAAAHAIVRFLADRSGLPEEAIAGTLQIREGIDVVRHLGRLAAGLESMVLGEDQIVGQIKAAMAAAQESEQLGQVLSKLIQSALAAGKTVRTQTGIARSHLSVVSVALDLARQALGPLRGRSILLIGAGQTAELALKHLIDEEPADLTIANRTSARAEALAERFRAHAIGLDAIAEPLQRADVVLCCTAAPGIVLDRSLVEQALQGRDAPLLLLDLAVPHDIDPAVAGMPGVTLFDVDDLQAICATNRAARASEIARADELIEESIARYMEWWAARVATPTIRALRERAEAIRSAEVQRTLARFPQLSEREQAAIQALSEAIVNKLLHPPITSLKDADGGELIGAARRLFQVEG